MEKINLYLMDISHSTNTSGVDRYLENLLEGLSAFPFIRVCHIHLLHDRSTLFCREEQLAHYCKMTIPLPQCYDDIVVETFWLNKYNTEVLRLTRHLFEGQTAGVIHLHTLNLIDLALSIRSEYPGFRVITHLHCIPWKGLYNMDVQFFNRLYSKMLKEGISEKNMLHFASNTSECRSYWSPDAVITVTNNAQTFVRQMQRTDRQSCYCIPNGMRDSRSVTLRRWERGEKSFQFLYVGNLAPSKGLKTILEALRLVQEEGYDVCLMVAGRCVESADISIRQEFSGLKLTLLGRVSLPELERLYIESDAGVIASLQEQCSYVAIEMLSSRCLSSQLRSMDWTRCLPMK